MIVTVAPTRRNQLEAIGDKAGKANGPQPKGKGTLRKQEPQHWDAQATGLSFSPQFPVNQIIVPY